MRWLILPLILAGCGGPDLTAYAYLLGYSNGFESGWVDGFECLEPLPDLSDYVDEYILPAPENDTEAEFGFNFGAGFQEGYAEGWTDGFNDGGC